MNFSDYPKSVYSISPQAAKNLSDTTKSVPMMEAITTRWLLAMLHWVPVEVG